MHISTNNTGMQLYRFTEDYESALGVWKAGEVSQFDQTTVDQITRDIGGRMILEEVKKADFGDVHDGTRHQRGFENEDARGHQEVMSAASMPGLVRGEKR